MPLKVDDVMKFSDDPAAEGRLRTEREKLALRNMQFFFGRGGRLVIAEVIRKRQCFNRQDDCILVFLQSLLGFCEP